MVASRHPTLQQPSRARGPPLFVRLVAFVGKLAAEGVGILRAAETCAHRRLFLIWSLWTN